ncbi:hypothetical protein LCGC14_2409810 [marine sediment metagenome]|uniref:Uncharacterized protein n=1 Tax=marine sediment metagenome TaxID=412755 RepID=A0A0F9CEY8_9ZZZZ
MSTRGTYTFKDENCEHHVYHHYDNYPSGAADFIKAALSHAWPLPRFEADEFAAAFVVGAKGIGRPGGTRLMKTGDWEEISNWDIEYHYEITCLDGELHIVAEEVEGVEHCRWDEEQGLLQSHRIFEGSYAEFLEFAKIT